MSFRSIFLLFWASLSGAACSSTIGTDGTGEPPPECSIGAPADLTAGPGADVGDSSGFTTITECGEVTENVVLGADLNDPDGLCLNVRADDVTIDGAGHRITASGAAVWIEGRSGVVVRNLADSARIDLYGPGTNDCTIENSTIEGVYLSGGDDHVIRNNHLTFFAMIVSADSDPALRLTFTGNHVEASGTDPVAFCGAYQHPCPETNYLIEGNIFENESGPSDVPNVLRIACAKKNTIRRNLMRAPNDAVGWYLRDEINDSVFEENTLWTNRGQAIWLAGGNVGKDIPSGNIFRNNLIRSDGAPSAGLVATGQNNTFQKNVFWGGTAWISGGGGSTWDRNTFVSRDESVGRLTYRDSPTDTFRSNIFYGPGPSLFIFDGFGFDSYTGDFNVFFQSSGPVNFNGIGTLAQWKQASIDAGHPADQNSIEADPGFVDAGAGDFRLSKDSSILGSGLDGVDPGAYPAGCSP